MNANLHAGMLEATRLTRAGQLLEATALIQRTLGGLSASPAAAAARGARAGTTFDGECRVVDPAPIALPAPKAQRTPPPREAAQPEAQRTPPPHEAAQPEAQRAAAAARAFGARMQEALQKRWGEFQLPTPGPLPGAEQAPGPTPEGGRFLSATYTGSTGSRAYKLYIPSGYHGQPLPLIVMLHGCTQNPDDFAAGTRMNALAEAHLCFVAYPAQSQAANVSKCWNWFKASDQQRDGGEPALIAGLTRQIVDTHCIDPQRIYVAGLSAGGAMAATMGTLYPELYAAAGIHSGLPHGAAQDLPGALAAMQGGLRASPGRPSTGARPAAPLPTIVFHGDRDTTVHPCNGEQVIAQAVPSRAGAGGAEARETLQVSVESGRVPGGHAYTRSIHHDANGQPRLEHWLIHGAGHAWSGGSPQGSYTDPKGPDAAREMLRFFEAHPQGGSARQAS